MQFNVFHRKVAAGAYSRLQHVSAHISDNKKGVAVIVNNRWCNPGHATVKHRFCSLEIELLAVSFRPYYPHQCYCSGSGTSCHQLEPVLRVMSSAPLLLSYRHNNLARS